MNYKLVALDLDGTLLNSSHELTIENQTVINKLSDQGISFVIVTGRPDLAVSGIIEKLKISPIVLANNGASIRDISSKKLYFSSFLEYEALLKALDILLKQGFYFRLYGLDRVYSFNKNEFDESINEFAIYSKRLATMMDFKIVNNIGEIYEPIIKLVCFENEPSRYRLAERLLKNISGVEVVCASKNGIDIMNQNTSKGSALLSYAHSLNINRNEIVAMGDSENDISMLKNCGFSVTLENGDSELKKIVNFVSESNDADGVAKALKFIFKDLL